MHWLAEIPQAVVNAHVAMLPRLDAEESLLAAMRVGVGSGSLKKDAAQSIQREWSRRANRTPRLSPFSTLPPPHKVGAKGFGVRKVPKRRKT